MVCRKTALVISDSLGDTACDVVLAAAAQFDEGLFRIVRIPRVRDVGEVAAYLEPRLARGDALVAFHTIADAKLRSDLVSVLSAHGVIQVDLLGGAIGALARLTDTEPRGIPGAIHRTDERYFKRIEAMEYFVEHDDGRACDDLADADIVLIGVSRTSKTPLAMYLAYLGYKVANIPLAPGMEPPAALFEVDPAKLFGLTSRVDVIADIRERRLGDDMARAVAGSYADPLAVEAEMRDARALMGRLGCFVVRTDEKAIEESAAEIVAQLERVRAARARRAGADFERPQHS